MLLTTFVAFLGMLFISGHLQAEVSDLSAVPTMPEQKILGNKNPEVPLTAWEDLNFHQAEDGREQVFDKNDEPFSGATQKRDAEGLMITYFYRNGFKNGIAVAYAEDGHLEQETTYRKGYKDGEEITFFENGKPKLKQTFAQDVLSGEEIIFYNNGKPERINHYANGLLDGETTYFDREGNITKKETYKAGKKNGLEHIISDNMLKEENNYVDNTLNGISKKYNQQYLVEEIAYEKGKRNGISKRYLENGSWSETEYKDDIIQGISRSFYPDKSLAESSMFADNLKNGLSEKYNQKGVKTSSENYKNGKLEGISRKFNDGGNLISVSYYVNGIEMAVINIDENSDLRDIYEQYKQKQLNKVIDSKNLWYPILWLGINLEETDILAALENEMKMYNADIADISIYQRESKAKFDDYNRKLFFGLNPLSYAVNITAPTGVLQKFAAEKENVDMPNPRGTTALIEAVRLNNLQMVKYLLAHKADVAKVYEGGNTILLYALKENVQNDIIEELIKAGADVNKADINGQTSLLLAIGANNEKLVDTLLENNADVKQKTISGKTVLAYAFENNVKPEIFARLILGGADVNQKDNDGNVLILQALTAQKYDVVEKLLQNGADVNLSGKNADSAVTYVLSHDVPENIKNLVFAADIELFKNLPKYNKPLWEVLIEQNKYDLLRIVVEKMGGISAKSENGKSVLTYLLENPTNEQLYGFVVSILNEKTVASEPQLLFQVIEAKNLDLLKKLVELGADVNAKNTENVSVLHYLLNKKYPLEYVKTLENGKLDVNADKALEFAILHDDYALAENLIKNGASVNLLTDNKDSYLMILNNKQDKMTELLLQNGADVGYVPESDRNLLMYAVKMANTTLINYLLQQGFSVDQVDGDGNTPLMYIADMVRQYAASPIDEINANIREIVPLLQNKGADINVQNNNGETLLIKIAKQKNPNYAMIASTLSDFGALAEKKDQYGKSAIDYAR